MADDIKEGVVPLPGSVEGTLLEADVSGAGRCPGGRGITSGGREEDESVAREGGAPPRMEEEADGDEMASSCCPSAGVVEGPSNGIGTNASGALHRA